MLNSNEQLRYQRQLMLPHFGEEAQEKLKNAKVFVAGAGGLGGPVCYYLAAAGVGQLVICDRDNVELSNLNRQILHGTNSIGAPKVDSALQTLSNLNPEIDIQTFHLSLDDNNINNVANNADIIIDCLDNITTRRVLNRFSIKNGIPLMHAGIDGWNAQLTLLNPPATPCINCLFDSAQDLNEPKPVLGAVAGVTGTMQALEAIKFLIGKSMLANTLLFFDAMTFECTKVPITKNEKCTVCGNL